MVDDKTNGEIETEKAQITELFQENGMAVEKIRYNENLDQYRVNIGVEGTDEQLLRDIRELGSDGPVDQQVDATKLARMEGRIQGSTTKRGEVNVIATNRDEHYLIELV